MKGCRALTEQEISDVYSVLKTGRDRTLFVVGLHSGLRISELLSLTISDVMEHGKIGSKLKVAKKNTKGKVESKTLPLTVAAQEELRLFLGDLSLLDSSLPIFKSTQSNRAITRAQAHNVLKYAFNILELKGNLSTHALRKSFANRMHIALGERIERTQIALRHRSLSSTVSYISVDHDEIDKVIASQGLVK